MKFSEVDDLIPAATGPLYTTTLQVYPNVSAVFPGRHQDQTDPEGLDFRVDTTSQAKGWVNHPFTHTDLFVDLQEKADADKPLTQTLVLAYAMVVRSGLDPRVAQNTVMGDLDTLPGLEPHIFLQTVQCLAVAEHRRYPQFASKFGGKFLPLRFSAGIAAGHWQAIDAANMQRRGRPGVEILEKKYGRTPLFKELMG